MMVRASLALLIAAFAFVPARAADVRIVYYDIHGRTVRDLFNEMQAKGPADSSGSRFPAYTRWRVSWNFRYESTPGSCKLTELNASVEGTTTLPHWVEGDAASTPLKKEWQDFIAALRVHESGHYAHGVEAAAEVQGIEPSIQPASDCPDLTRQVTHRAESILEKYRAIDAQYDRDTNHGQKQGAVLMSEN